MSLIKIKSYYQGEHEDVLIGGKELHPEAGLERNLKLFFFSTIEHVHQNLLDEKMVYSEEMLNDEVKLSASEKKAMKDSILFVFEDDKGNVLFEANGNDRPSRICERLESMLNGDESMKSENTDMPSISMGM